MCLFVIVFWHRGEAIKSNGYHHQDSYIGGLLTAADRCKKFSRIPLSLHDEIKGHFLKNLLKYPALMMHPDQGANGTTMFISFIWYLGIENLLTYFVRVAL